MKIIQTSSVFWSERENGVKVDCNIVEDNGLLDVLKDNLKHTKKFVYIATDPDAFDDVDESVRFILLAYKKKGLEFDEVEIIDRRNDSNLKEILSGASLIYIPGGRVDISSDYYYDIDLREYLKDSDALLLGQSAGAMCFAEVIYNYPETNDDIDGIRFLEGLNLCWPVIIPHYEEVSGNRLLEGDFNLLNDYYIPDSYTCSFYALKDGSFIFTDGDDVFVYGEAYLIKDGKVNKICDNDCKQRLL